MHSHPPNLLEASSYSVASILLSTKGLNDEMAKQMKDLGILLIKEEAEFTVTFGYGVGIPIPVLTIKLNNQTTLGDLLIEAAKLFEKAFGVVDPATGTSASIIPRFTNCEMMIKQVDDQKQVIGKWLSTPFFEGVYIDVRNKTIYFSIGT